MLTRVLILLVSLLAPLGAQAAVYAENCADTVTDFAASGSRSARRSRARFGTG